ncbi:MAG TPA: 4Fe-4S binding protein, partial [Spirochaetota bacterium]
QGYESKIWVNHPDDIEVCGESIESFAVPFKKIEIVKEISFFQRGFLTHFAPLAERLFVPKPYILRKKCILCKRCVQICQAHALAEVEDAVTLKRHIVVNHSRCIRCYCCHEICPADAIELKRRWW